jgi:hypothetical protein
MLLGAEEMGAMEISALLPFWAAQTLGEVSNCRRRSAPGTLQKAGGGWGAMSSAPGVEGPQRLPLADISPAGKSAITSYAAPHSARWLKALTASAKVGLRLISRCSPRLMLT